MIKRCRKCRSIAHLTNKTSYRKPSNSCYNRLSHWRRVLTNSRGLPLRPSNNTTATIASLLLVNVILFALNSALLPAFLLNALLMIGCPAFSASTATLPHRACALFPSTDHVSKRRRNCRRKRPSTNLTRASTDTRTMSSRSVNHRSIHTLMVGGYKFTGVSVAGLETCIGIPPLIIGI